MICAPTGSAGPVETMAFNLYAMRTQQIEDYITALRRSEDWTDESIQSSLAAQLDITYLTDDEKQYIINILLKGE